ncbi:MAG TPA: DEAD/DEAH box helicase [Rhizomicrobium sp.]|nr:DEAD/DEAH box helicase [Rhizomicrobium sp.]
MSFPATHPALSRALAERQYTEPTPVQRAVIEPEAEGRDLLVSAQTGSGKTIAFGLAMAETLLEGAHAFGPARDPLALIIAPTRELALQVQRELGWLYHHTGARIVSCVGGMDPGRERRELSDGAHIVVGTPGRLRDHIERRALKLEGLRCAVLDEADEMLDMGFREDLQFILETTPQDRRTLLFSATLPKAIVTLAAHYQKDALRIATRGEASGHADIEYRAIRIAGNKIERAVVNLLRFLDPPGALVFCNTRNAVRHMEAQLTERGFSCVALSGELSQSERNHALQALRDGRAKVCVATDVAARGIDLPGLSLVIHAELPNDAQVLQHRSGRTGRAGKKGVSVLLVPPSRRRRAEEMLGRARVNAVWGNAPSAEDIRKVDQQRLLENPLLVEPGTDDDLAMADELLKTHTPRQLASAFVKMYRAGLPAPEEIEDEGPYQQGHKAPREHQGRKPREERQEHKSREDRGPREQRPRPHKTSERQYAPTHERGAAPGDMANGVWFRLNVGRERNADPKWLLPEICRQGEVTKKDIGAIRVFEMETLFQVDPAIAPKFTILVSERKKGGVRISPALDQTGQSTARPRERLVSSDTPGDAPPRKPGFHGKKFAGGKKKFGGKAFGNKKFGGKPGGHKGKKPSE